VLLYCPVLLAAKGLDINPLPFVLIAVSLFMFFNSTVKNPIGGWLLYFYFQLYLGCLVALYRFMFTTMPLISPMLWPNHVQYLLFVLKHTASLALLIVLAVVATFLLFVRTWHLLELLRALIIGYAGIIVFSILVDMIYWPHLVRYSAPTLLWQGVWIPYFYVSKRVQRVFKTHDWEFPTPAVSASVGYLPPSIANVYVPLSEGPVTSRHFEFRFFLAEEEFTEAVGTRRAWLRTTWGKCLSRLFFAALVSGAAYFPYIDDRTWPMFLQAEPQMAWLLIVGGLFALWIAIGAPGMSRMERKMNKFDVERQMSIDEAQFAVRHGSVNIKRPWPEFDRFTETPNLFVLQGSMDFWTIPKRIMSAGEVNDFRVFLKSKLTADPWSIDCSI